jgi:hypothetical protein
MLGPPQWDLWPRTVVTVLLHSLAHGHLMKIKDLLQKKYTKFSVVFRMFMDSKNPILGYQLGALM